MRPFFGTFVLLLLAVPTRAEPLPDKPIPPREAPSRMTLPDGFRVTLFAGEPDVRQPIAFTFDDRGRLWVAECYSYPNWLKTREGKDRILVFEDTDGDGHFDTCKVFADNLANVSGLEVGFGGVWVCATPYLLFIPDRDGNDVPDGPPEVVLDGWSLEAKHNVFNDLTWGPDGWLYGCNGITATSYIGKPGTPDAGRVPLNCGVWRFHPTRRVFEVVAWGTTNPWGLDFDDFGQMFITNCVIKHLWHVVPGAHFQRMFGQDLNPYCYDLMASCADHIHWGGGPWQSSRGGQGPHDEAGGGHAHVGCMVYLGDNWPDRYRNGVFMCNLHGNRVNNDILERRGSGYVAHHGKDFLFANDPWFRGITIRYGPDGGVFVSDWCDTGECHNYDRVDRTNGRIYKVTYGKPVHVAVDLPKLDDAELVKLQLHKNDWYVRHARRLLQERAAQQRLAPDTHAALRRILSDHPDVTRKLRALWALHVTGGIDEKLLFAVLESRSEYLRGWAVQLGLDKAGSSGPGSTISPALQQKLADMAVKDPSPFVRLYLASALQRLPVDERWPIARGLASHQEDAQDVNLPLLVWYGIEPLVPADRDRAVELLARAEIPLVREYLARRIVALGDTGLVPLLGLLGRIEDPALHRDVLRGIQEALAGRRQVALPEGWQTVYPRLVQSPSPEVRERALAVAVTFGDARAVAALRKLVQDPKAATAARESALQTLLYRGGADLVPLLQDLLRAPAVRRPALRALAAFPDSSTPPAILRSYSAYSDNEKADAVQTLASRPAFALALLDAVERGQVLRRHLSAYTVRQMLAFNDRAVRERLTKVWGTVRPASQEKASALKKYKTLLSADSLKAADRAHGRVVFRQTCATCHRLFDEGASIGPELTGGQRGNLDYLLENILDPSAVVPQEYQVTVLTTKDGRVLTGIIKQEGDRTVTLQTQNEAVLVPKDEIETRTKSPVSMMPEGMLDKLTHDEVRDLIAYVSGPGPVALPAGK
jgi:putative membrane-bound dehydrogenase-like protein